MLRSKSRSVSVDFGQKNYYSSVFARTLSASKLCRGDALGSQIDSNALKSVDKKPSKILNLSQNSIESIMSMQQEKGGLEKYRSFDQLRGAKKETHEANMKANESLMMDIENLKKMLSISRDEIKTRDKKIDSLELELRKTRAFEYALAEKDASLNRLNNELIENKKRIVELNDEIEREKKSRLSDNDSENEIKRLKLELQTSQESEKKAEKEAKLAMEAEEKSAKAMEHLALALKEVATDLNHTKKKLEITQIELNDVKGEAEQLKTMVRSTENRYQKLLTETKQEADLYKNTADRLRVEAEESLMAWNGKEMGFVSCIKRAEDEKGIAQIESVKFSEALKAAKEETSKLRDVLKQAVNEANAAKAAAGIARDENSLLKDCLSEKEEAVHFLTRENERLRIKESMLQESVNELKMLLSTVSIEYEDKAIGSSSDEENEKKTKKVFSFKLEDVKVLHEDPEKSEALKGSIFDANAHTPKSIFDDEGKTNCEGFDCLDSDSEKSSHRRVRTIFRRVGDILMIRKSVLKKEPSVE